MASRYEGAQDLSYIEGALEFVADIWLGIMLVEIDSGAGAESCKGRKILLAHDQHLLEIFGWVSYRFGIFGLGLTSVEYINAPDRSPGEEMPCR